VGGDLTIIARFPEGSVRVDQFTALGETEPEAAD
jgi:hypothetical protein